jgi:hypothetical protein
MSCFGFLALWWMITSSAVTQLHLGSTCLYLQDSDDRMLGNDASNSLPGQVMQALSIFDQALVDATVQVTITEFDATGAMIARVSEWITSDRKSGMYQAELARYALNVSANHPVFLQVARSGPDNSLLIQQTFTFDNGRATNQSAWIRLFGEATTFDYRGSTPLFGRLIPEVASISAIQQQLDWRVVDGPDTRTTVGQGNIGQYGQFEITLSGTDKSLLQTFSRTIAEGDRITAFQHMGAARDPLANPRLIVWECTEWTNPVYDRESIPTKLLSIDRTSLIRRKNGAEETFRAQCRFDYIEKRQISYPRIAWSLPELVVPDGNPVETSPTDHRRFEFLRENVFLIVDDAAESAVRKIEFEGNPAKTISTLSIATMAVMVIFIALALSWMIVRMRNCRRQKGD